MIRVKIGHRYLLILEMVKRQRPVMGISVKRR